LKQVRIFFTDLDGTVVGNPAATERFRDFWQGLNPDTRPLLVFNSGRLIDDQIDLMEQTPLPQPDYMIGGVGTMLLARDQPGLKAAYATSLGQGFDTAAIHRVISGVAGISLQPEQYQHGFKSSWYLHDADEEAIAVLETRLTDAGIDARIVYSSHRDLDILPRAADKGAAIRWLCDHLELDLGDAVVAGDTGNDRAMFDLPDIRGVVVANALPELKAIASDKSHIFLAEEEEADGVIQGLKHWGAHIL
jgi:mannosylfructose-6-phosphate phosphatase